MKTGLRASWFPRVGWEGLGNTKMKHEKWFGCFMAPKSGMGRRFGCFSRFPRVGWEGLGKASNET